MASDTIGDNDDAIDYSNWLERAGEWMAEATVGTVVPHELFASLHAPKSTILRSVPRLGQ
jgi:hypothetical protein